jgi:hypothetical protein
MPEVKLILYSPLLSPQVNVTLYLVPFLCDFLAVGPYGTILQDDSLRCKRLQQLGLIEPLRAKRRG